MGVVYPQTLYFVLSLVEISSLAKYGRVRYERAKTQRGGAAEKNPTTTTKTSVVQINMGETLFILS